MIESHTSQKRSNRNSLIVGDAFGIARSSDPSIEGFEEFHPNSVQGRQGKDLLVKTTRGEVPLKVEDDLRKAQVFAKTHPKIPVLLVTALDTARTVAKEIIRIVESYWRATAKKIEKIKGRETIRRKERQGRFRAHTFCMAH